MKITYKKAMACVLRVRIFSVIFVGYIDFKEGVINILTNGDHERRQRVKEGGRKRTKQCYR